MKKLILLFFLFVFSKSFYAQEIKTNKRAKTEKAIKVKADEAKETKNSMSDKGIEKSTAGKAKAAENKADTKIKNESKKIEKTEPKTKESNEKAPKKKDKVTGKYNGKKVYTGPKGGEYYINSKGNKTYLQD